MENSAVFSNRDYSSAALLVSHLLLSQKLALWTDFIFYAGDKIQVIKFILVSFVTVFWLWTHLVLQGGWVLSLAIDHLLDTFACLQQLLMEVLKLLFDTIDVSLIFNTRQQNLVTKSVFVLSVLWLKILFSFFRV